MHDEPRRQGVRTPADKQRWTDLYFAAVAGGASSEEAKRVANDEMLRRTGKNPLLAAPYGKRK